MLLLPKMTPRKSTLLFLWLCGLLALFGGMLAHASWSVGRAGTRLARAAETVRALAITDPALFPEANYTRHLSQADWHTPFQDAPTALEHFPSGTLTRPPYAME